MKTTQNESKFLTRAKADVAKVVFPQKVQGPLCSVLQNLEIGMRRTYNTPIKGKIQWDPVEGFHCTLSFELWLPNPDKPHTYFRWELERGASGDTLDAFIDDVREVMRMVDRNKANVEKGLALLHVQNMKRIENEELARGLTAVEEDRK